MVNRTVYQSDASSPTHTSPFASERLSWGLYFCVSADGSIEIFSGLHDTLLHWVVVDGLFVFILTLWHHKIVIMVLIDLLKGLLGLTHRHFFVGCDELSKLVDRNGLNTLEMFAVIFRLDRLFCWRCFDAHKSVQRFSDFFSFCWLLVQFFDKWSYISGLCWHEWFFKLYFQNIRHIFNWFLSSTVLHRYFYEVFTF